LASRNNYVYFNERQGSKAQVQVNGWADGVVVMERILIMWIDVGINLLSDVIFLLAALLIFGVYYLFSDRMKLLKFFGIWNSKKITIYISNLNVLHGGTTGIDGSRYSFQGSSIAAEESKAATRLQNLFNYFLPKQVDKPELLNKILISDIDVTIIPSPNNINEIEQSTSIIVLGSPAYNLVSTDIQNDNRTLAKFEKAEMTTILNTKDEENYLGEHRQIVPSGWAAGTATPILSDNSLHTGTPTPFSNDLPVLPQSTQSIVQQIVIPNVSPYRDPHFGFVQRYFDFEKQRNIFYVAGLSDFSTSGCVYYLISNWKKLSKKHGGTTAFVVLLKIDATDNNKSQVVFEKTKE